MIIRYERSSDIVERKLIRLILTNHFTPGSFLPSERELASNFDVGRPTVREAIQRLERDGWVQVQRGHPARVNNYWKKGNLYTLVNIFRNTEPISDDLVKALMELRAVITPVYMRDALEAHPTLIYKRVSMYQGLADDPEAFARFDWELQKDLASLSTNPLYLLLLNSFDSIYIPFAERYFQSPVTRQHSLSFYKDLSKLSKRGDAKKVEQVTREVMWGSIRLWEQEIEANNRE